LSHNKKDGKKKRHIKKIIYYDSDTSSSSLRDDDDEDSSSKKKIVNQNYSFDSSRIPYNPNARLLSIPLGKPPHFDGEDYSFWSHKLRSHLFSLPPIIWEIVENGMHFGSTDNHVLINEQIHKNAQATTVLLASLCKDEYNKVSGLDNAKQIWDTLRIFHEGNDVTMITKMELVEGVLGRFSMKRGEEPTETYNKLKTLVNKFRSYRSTRWTDHDVVRVMLRSFTVIDPHLINLIRENPRYTKMTPDKILRKFLGGHMMVKEARFVDDLANVMFLVYEPQPVALKATNSKEALPSKVAQEEAAGLNEDEMALVIKRFKTALKERKEYPNKNKSKGKRSCFKCGKSSHFIAQCPDNDNDQAQEKKGKKERKKNYRKAKGEAHIGKEWDSNCSSSDSDNEGLAASVFNKSSLFPNKRHTCLLAKEKKVRTRDTPKYTSSSDEKSFDDEVDYIDLFKGLLRSKVDKINELIDALNEKDGLLEKQEDILYEEHDKFIIAQKSLTLETKKNELLSSELSACNDSISNLKNLNADLNAKLERVNVASSTMEHVVICNRCKDFEIDACNKHASTILKLNNDVASLNAQLKTCKDDYEKLKFVRDAYTICRHPFIKDGLGFQKGTKNFRSQRTYSLNKENGKAPMASSSYSSHDQKNHAYLYTHVNNVSSVVHHDRCYNHVVLPIHHDAAFNSHVMFASSSSYAHCRNRPRRHHVPSHAPRKASNRPTMLYQTCDASFVLLCKNDKVVARSLGPKCKRDKTCIWVPKSFVTNLVGPNKS
jgi:ribosomal protein S14